MAFLAEETGSSEVEAALEEGGAVGAANWSEVAQKVQQHRRSWEVTRALLLTYPLEVEPVTMEDAEVAAVSWRRDSGLSLGDRLCLALAARLDATVLSADGAWAGLPSVRLIR